MRLVFVLTLVGRALARNLWGAFFSTRPLEWTHALRTD